MKLLRKITASILSILVLSIIPYAPSWAAKYLIDVEGAHAFIQFRVQHLGYSWLYGRFNDFSGYFEYDKATPEKSFIELTIHTKSIDSNHAERDRHLRGGDFLDVKKYPTAHFKSTKYIPKENGKGVLEGELTLHGQTNPIVIEVEKIGEGGDPWGGYRAGFEGRATFLMGDFGMETDLGPKSRKVEMFLTVEGIRQ